VAVKGALHKERMLSVETWGGFVRGRHGLCWTGSMAYATYCA